MRHVLFWWTMFWLAVWLMLSASLCRGATVAIPITNANFEAGGVADGTAPGLFSTTIPTGWSSTGGVSTLYGYLNPQNALYNGTTGSPGVTGTMSGANVFDFGVTVLGGGIGQTLTGQTFNATSQYDFTIALGYPKSGVPGGLIMDLVAGSTVVATTTIAAATYAIPVNLGTFADYTLTLAPTPALSSFNGQTLSVRLRASTTLTTVNIDNARLNVTLVPEPAPVCLIAASGMWVGIVALRRRRWYRGRCGDGISPQRLPRSVRRRERAGATGRSAPAS